MTGALKFDQMCHFDATDARTKGNRKPFGKLRRQFEASPSSEGTCKELLTTLNEKMKKVEELNEKTEMSDPSGLKCDQMCHFDATDARTKGDRKPFEKLRRQFEPSPLKPRYL